MAKALYVEGKDLNRMLKIAAVSGELPVRNVALLTTIYGTGMMLTEVATLPLKAYLRPDGAVLVDSEVPTEIAYNGNARPVKWTSKRVIEAVDAYLAYRTEHRHRLTTRAGAYRGLDPDAPIFLTDEGAPYKLTQRKTATGAISYSCDSLNQLFRRLHAQAGIEGANAMSARRSFAINMSKNADLKTVKIALGLKTLRATKNLIDADPVRLGTFAAGVF
jgi:site-specific recombinase XerD